MDTAVVILGAGPAGLTLERLLHRAGVDAVVLERQSRAHCEARVRAGLLEPGTVDVLRDLGLSRAGKEGVRHDGLVLQFRGERHRIPVAELTGRASTVFPQQEVVKDLLRAGDATGARRRFCVEDVRLHDLETDAPSVTFVEDGRERRLTCAWVAGCDGFHGASRGHVPPRALRTFEAPGTINLLGVLADVPPSTHELVYGLDERGFAMHSMRTPALTRLYLQHDAAEDAQQWSADRVWDELRSRLATRDGEWDQPEGPLVERSSFAIRAFLAEPMRHGRLLLAGDAAHIVPPTGGKGLNAAVFDAVLLADALAEHVVTGSTRLLDGYSSTALQRAWAMLQFSVWMTDLLSIRRPGDPYELAVKHAELEQICAGGALTQAFAERYVGRFAGGAG